MHVNYMVMNRETAECEVYGKKSYAEKHLNDKCFMFPVDSVDHEMEAELVLYPNTNKSAELSWVAEYKNGLWNSDLETADESNPVKFIRG